MDTLYLDDLRPGQVFQSASHVVTADDIRRFGAEFDPQPFHTDDEAAKGTFFNGLAASGWHTAALTMRLLVTSTLSLPWGIIGAGVDELRWLRPVRPGDSLSVTIEVLEVREMRSKPGQGIVRIRVLTLDGRGETVQSFVSSLVVPRRGMARPS